MLRAFWLLVTCIFGFICFTAAASAAQVNPNNYDIYIGDINNDGQNDIYLAQKPWPLIIHGDIAIPILLKGSKNYALYGSGADYSSPASYTLTEEDLLSLLNTGGLVKGQINSDFFVVNSSTDESSVLVRGKTSSDPAVLIQSFDSIDLPIVLASYSAGKFIGISDRNVQLAIKDVNTDGKVDILLTSTSLGSYAYLSDANQIPEKYYQVTVNPFDFATQAPSIFKYNLADKGSIPTFSENSIVAITKGSANVSGGAATYSIPIQLPPSVADLVPALSLSYNSQAGEGYLGHGWTLDGLPSITRCSTSYSIEGASKVSKSNPAYTISDRLCLSGEQLIVSNNKTPSDADYWKDGTEFRTEIDSFSRVIGHGGGGDQGFDYFEVITKEGKTLIFGGNDDSQYSKILSVYNDVSRISGWALSKVQDRYGNAYTVTYQRDSSTGEHLPHYLSFSPNSSVVFNYTSRTGQFVARYDAGNKTVSTKLLDSITTYINVPAENSPESGSPVLRYDVNYSANNYSQIDLVSQISKCGYESGAWNCARPLEFAWTQGEFGVDESNSVSLKTCDGQAVSPSQMVDIDGDGLNDILGVSNGTVWWGTPEGCFNRAQLNLAGASSDGAVNSAQPYQTANGISIAVVRKVAATDPYKNKFSLDVITNIDKGNSTGIITNIASVILYQAQAYIGDFNNDGLDDFRFGYSDTYIQVNATSFSINNANSNYKDYSSSVGHFSTDTNSDGLLDDVSTGVSQSNYSDPSTFSTSYSVNNIGYRGNNARPYEVSNCGIYSSVAQYKDTGDINGDGQYDYVIYNGNWRYRLGTGQGVTSEVDTGVLASTATMPSKYAHYSYLFDYDKDGRDDLIAVVPEGSDICKARILFSRENSIGTSFVESNPYVGVKTIFSPIGGSLCNPTSEPMMANIFPGDINNDGIIDFSYNGHIYYGRRAQPNLLATVTDGLGGQIKFTYDTLNSTLNNGVPLYTPSASKPIFPQVNASRARQVVSKVEVSNGKGGFNARYFNYVGAKSDVRGRGFLGFEKIIETDKASNVVVSTEYLQSFPYIGSVKNKTVSTTGGLLISKLNNFYTSRSTGTAALFPTVYMSLSKTYELLTSDENKPVSVVKTLINSHNKCGDPSSVTLEVGGGFSGTNITSSLVKSEITFGFNTFTNCEDSFATSRTKKLTQIQTNEVKTIVTQYRPNSQNDIKTQIDFQGTTKEVSTVFERESNGLVNKVSSTAIDYNGALLATRDSVLSDFDKGLFPRLLVNPMGHQSNVEYDYRFGEPRISYYGSQRIKSESVYNIFGGLTRSINNEGTNTNYYSFYCESSVPVVCPQGAAFGSAITVTNAAASGYLGQPPVISFYDQLGRQIRNSVYGFDGKVTNTALEYNANGTLARASAPYVTKGLLATVPSTAKWTSYSAYDALGQAHAVTQPDGGSLTVTTTQNNLGLKTELKEHIIKSSGVEDRISSRIENALGQVVQSLDSLGNYVDFTYDAQGNLRSTLVNNSLNTLVSLDYDIAGNRIYIDDPDTKKIDFDYNGFGELRRQLWQKGTANQKYMVFDYDKLGRVVQRTDYLPGVSGTINSWVWDTKQTGQLSYREGGGYKDTYSYNAKSQLSSITTEVSGLSPQVFNYTYDAFGRSDSETYPNGFKVQHKYHALGYQAQIWDAASARLLWALGNQLDETGNLTHSLYGNGVVTRLGFDSTSGRIKKIQSGKLTSTNTISSFFGDVQSLSYVFDTHGNLSQRISDKAFANGSPIEALQEDFTYDSLNRLRRAVTRYGGMLDFGGQEISETTYDNLGNITSKTRYGTGSSVNTDLGSYSYAMTGNAGPHAVTYAGGKLFGYDAYGNMDHRGSEVLEYSVFNKPTKIIGAATTLMSYGPDHDLYKEVNGDKTTYKLGNYEVEVQGAQVVQKSYVDGVIVNSRTLNSNVLAEDTFFFLHMDYLGSLESTTDDAGRLVNRASFDAWGNRRQPTWAKGWPDDVFVTKTGFAGHYQLDAHKLVHMGGRVYDPSLGRFLSADLFVQAPLNTQSYNRYSYVFNNPLSLNDPSGYCSGGPDTVSQLMLNKMVEQLDSMHMANIYDAMSFLNRPKTNVRVDGDGEGNQRNQQTNNGNSNNDQSQNSSNSLERASGSQNGLGGWGESDQTIDADGLEGVKLTYHTNGTSNYSVTNSQYQWSYFGLRALNTFSLSGEMLSFAMRYVKSDMRDMLAQSMDEELRRLNRKLDDIANPLHGQLARARIITSNWEHDIEWSLNGSLLAMDGVALLGGAWGRYVWGKSIKEVTKGRIIKCFPPGTLVLMADGTTKPIENVEVGEEVMAMDADNGGDLVARPVTDTHQNKTMRLFVIEFDVDKDGIADGKFEATGEHPIWTTNLGWRDAKDLSVGDILLTETKDTVNVINVSINKGYSDTFNLSVDGVHTFFIVPDGTPILVHNTPRIHGVAPDWAVKGAHVTTTNGIELSIRGGGNGISIKPVFSADANSPKLKAAIAETEAALNNANWRATLLDRTTKATEMLGKGSALDRAGSGGTRALEVALQKWCN